MTTKLKKLSVLVMVFFFVLSGVVSMVSTPITREYHQPTVAHAADGENSSSTARAVTTSTTEISEWQNFRCDKYGFEFRYPPDEKVQTYSSTQQKIVKMDMTVPPDTLLQEKFLVVKIRKDFERCASSFSGAESRKVVYINDRKYFKEEFKEGATGDIYSHTVYSTKRKKSCFSLDFVLHSTNPEVYGSPPPDFGRSESEVFLKILSTFRFI